MAQFKLEGYQRIHAWGNGTAGTVIAALTDYPCDNIVIQAANVNAGTIFVGYGTLLTTSNAAYELPAGSAVSLPVKSSGMVNLIAGADGQVYHYSIYQD